jgi:hypothetical protein
MEAALFRFLSLRKSRLRGSMRSWHVRRHGNGTGDCHISGNLAELRELVALYGRSP